MRARRMAVALPVLAGALGAFTWMVLESSGVGVLRTRTRDGAWRATHVWYAAHDGGLWVEAATPERPFLLDIRARPEVTLSFDGNVSPYHGEVRDTPADHARVRALLRAKYGFRDWFVGLFQDTSRSVAVVLRLEPRR